MQSILALLLDRKRASRAALLSPSRFAEPLKLEHGLARRGRSRNEHGQFMPWGKLFDQFEADAVNRMPVDGHRGRGITLPRKNDAGGIERIGAADCVPRKQQE